MAEKPRYKKQGPIRFEAIVPLAIVVAAVILYFTLFFDFQLRKGIEWAAGRGNGAEVNIASVRTSFWRASFEMTGLQVTDPSEPAFDRVRIGRIHWRFLWDAVLRGKAVIPTAGVMGIGAHVPRARPGQVYPKEESKGGSSVMAGLRDKLKDKIQGTVLGDIAQFVEGFDPSKQIKDLGNLKAVAQIEALGRDLEAKEKQWGEALSSMPGQADVDRIQKDLDSIQLGGSKNPADIQKQVAKVQSLIGEVTSKADSVKKQGTAISSGVQDFSKSVGTIDDMARKDLEDAESRLNLPKLEPKELATQFFGAQALSKVEEAQKYSAMAQEYMPPKASASAPNPKPSKPPRARGRSYQFGRPNGYPAFWLQRAEVSSSLGATDYEGTVSGEILDVASNQAQAGRPTTVQLKGDFPKQGIQGVAVKAILDHRTDQPLDRLTATVATFPVEGRMLSQSADARFGFSKALGSAEVEGEMRGDQVRFVAASAFRDVGYEVSAKSKILDETLKRVAGELSSVTVKAIAQGTWADLDLSIESNLAAALARAFQKELQAKLEEARRKLKAMIDEKVMKPKAELLGRVEKTKAQVLGQIDDKRKKVEALKAQAESKLAQAKKQLAPDVKGKAINKLKKKLPF